MTETVTNVFDTVTHFASSIREFTRRPHTSLARADSPPSSFLGGTDDEDDRTRVQRSPSRVCISC